MKFKAALLLLISFNCLAAAVVAEQEAETELVEMIEMYQSQFSDYHSKTLFEIAQNVPDRTGPLSVFIKVMGQKVAAGTILEKRAANGDIWGISHVGQSNALVCAQAVSVEVANPIACAKSRAALTEACVSGIARDCYTRGFLAENGYGENVSLIIASDSYLSASKLYFESGDREAALANFEHAQRTYPRHPNIDEFADTLFAN